MYYGSSIRYYLLKKVNSNWKKIADRYSMFKLAVPTAAQLPAELADIPRSKLHIFPLYSSYLAFETLRKGSFQLAVEKDSLFILFQIELWFSK